MEKQLYTSYSCKILHLLLYFQTMYEYSPITESYYLSYLPRLYSKWYPWYSRLSYLPYWKVSNTKLISGCWKRLDAKTANLLACYMFMENARETHLTNRFEKLKHNRKINGHRWISQSENYLPVHYSQSKFISCRLVTRVQ